MLWSLSLFALFHDEREGKRQSEFPFTTLAVIIPARAVIPPRNKTLDQFDCQEADTVQQQPKQEVGRTKGA